MYINTKTTTYLFFILLTGCGIIHRPAENKMPILDIKNNQKKNSIEVPDRMCFITGGSRIIGPVDEQFDHTLALSNKSVTITPFFIFDTPITIGDYKKYLNEFEDYLIRLYNNIQSPSLNPNKEDNKKILDSNQKKNQNTTKQKNEASVFISTEEFYEVLAGHIKYKDKINQKPFMAACQQKIKPKQEAFTEGLQYQFEDKMNHYGANAMFDNYPAIFVNYHQAEWYLSYLTFVTNEYRKKNRLTPYPAFELPSVAQWEHAATDDTEVTPQRFSWGKTPKGEREEKYANFKYLEHNNSLQPVNRINAYKNHNGLYDMQGNINEWTKDSYYPAMNATISGLDPVYLDKKNPNKVIKGGSWNDPYTFQEISYNGCANAHFQSSTISFRPIMKYYGGF